MQESLSKRLQIVKSCKLRKIEVTTVVYNEPATKKQHGFVNHPSTWRLFAGTYGANLWCKMDHYEGPSSLNVPYAYVDSSCQWALIYNPRLDIDRAIIPSIQ